MANGGGTWRVASCESRVPSFTACSLALALIAGCGAAFADDTQVYYSPETNLETVDVGLIDKAARTIDMAAYMLTDAPARGVRIRLFRFPSDRPDGQAVSDLMPTPGVESVSSAGRN